jgi:hypothetical protein
VGIRERSGIAAFLFLDELPELPRIALDAVRRHHSETASSRSLARGQAVSRRGFQLLGTVSL